MKKIIVMFVLLLSFVVWQGCVSENKESEKELTTNADAEALEIEKAEAVAARKEKLIKASAEKAHQRSIAAAERARLALTYKDATGKTVYYKTDVEPAYTGGLDELKRYLKDNLKYPAKARDGGIEGTVFVDFIVDEKGSVRQVLASDVVGEDVDLSLKEEAVRVVAAMPGWKPGRHNGKAVDASFSIPITFEIVN